ncbi:GlsB/YeaQ/YmgE family stress response membrane protein [Desulfosarcina ovata]|uniref:GlsB/YeaQ/YmgE family stress response membrane protein n=1 Tax=Desulfosarcina ovata TaxID=83564 RepID=UPI0012D36E6C|nr:GlsB/YeaQ/YmgE family stress response membrane protein [Desulfosarcina ovata]
MDKSLKQLQLISILIHWMPNAILIGIAGAFVGGFIGSLLGLGTVTGFNIGSFLLAIGGALLLLVLYRVIKKK